jgi:hypothetical protein
MTSCGTRSKFLGWVVAKTLPNSAGRVQRIGREQIGFVESEAVANNGRLRCRPFQESER